jgi:hypothetical protein
MRAIAFVILLAPGLLVSKAAQDLFGDSNYLVFALCLFVGEFCVVVLFHELGHALSAIAFGWPIEMFAVTPFAYRTKTKRLEFWYRMGADVGGMVLYRPTTGRTPARLAMISFAGPLASFMFAALMLTASAFSPWPFWRDLFGSTGAVSVFFGLGNLIPFRTSKGLKSDGLGIIDALRQPKLRRRSI